jgi:NAD(P)H-dependent FMN reductase
MPIYDGDIEDKDGLPSNAKKLKKLFLEHHGLLLACPEYNSSITGVLKNTIDWVSRQETDDEKPLACYTGKMCALVSASPGGFGGLRGLVTVRSILGNLGVIMVPEQVCVPKAHEAFNENGTLKDAKLAAAVEKVAAKLVTLTTSVFRKELG